MKFSKSFIRQVVDATDLVDLISDHGVTLKRVGSSYKGLCPFHSEKTPSFNVNPERGFFHCFGCSVSGDGLKFLMQYDRLSFSEAVKVGKVVYLSGVIGDDGNGNLVEGGLVPEAHQAFKLMEATLAKFHLGFNDVFKCLVMIDDISQWGLFNTVYTQYFDKPYPARSAFGADGLALNASFEMECMAYISD